MTELRDFISSVLSDICEGVQLSTQRIEELGGVVNPRAMRSEGPIEMRTRRAIVQVSFDLSVEAEATAGNRGRVGVLIANIGLGTERQTTENHRSANSVKFTVPLVLPVDPARIQAEHDAEDAERRRQTAAIRGGEY